MAIKNAIIIDATLLIEDHGFLTAFIYLDYGGTQQGFGGYALHSSSTSINDPNVTGIFIWKVLEVVGVDSWRKLIGEAVRVDTDYLEVKGIGNIIKDVWFYPKEYFASEYWLEVPPTKGL